MNKKLLSLLCLPLLLTGCNTATTLPMPTTDQKPVVDSLPSQIPDSASESAPAAETITQRGPYGSITVSIPAEWSYELLDADDTALLSAEYGIHLYLSDDAEKYIEIGYCSSFGICGTGLETETRTLAGDEANICYYDGLNMWNYVFLYGKNDGILATSHSVDSWEESDIETTFQILDTIQFDSSKQYGAIGVYAEDSYIDDIHVSVSAKNISPTHATLNFGQYDTSVATELSFGEDFIIEKKEAENWKEAAVAVEGDYGFNAVAHTISKGSDTQYEYNWEWLYGALAPGEYRLGVNILSLRAPGDYDTYTAYAHFLIR